MTYDLSAPADPDLAPGEARCPGPSTRDIILKDGDNPPAAIVTEQSAYLGDQDMALSRYTDSAYYDAEMERMWSRTWQWACREEQIPNPGDYSVYDVGPYSVIVLRHTDQSIRAFVNSCPHRGMQFFDAATQGQGKQFLRCPFHGMSWNLDGSLREIPCRWDFPHVQDDNFGLTEVQTGTWGGFVFINLDPNAGPLNDYLEVLPEHFRETPLEKRFVAVHIEKMLPGNWKMCMEAFLEAYHVLATHPEGLRTTADANAQYDVFGDNVTRFVHTFGHPSPHLPKQPSEPELFAALGHDPDDLPEGTGARQRHADLLRQSLSSEWGADLSDVSTSILLDSIEYHLFPNACFFPGINIRLIYRFRPAGYDRTIHDVLLLQPVPDNEPRPKPAEIIRLGIDDSYTTVDSFVATGLAALLDQDTDNFKRQWAGMRASLRGTQTLGNYQESRIRAFHRTLDQYLES